MCTPTYFLMKYNPRKGFWMTINYKINHVIWNFFYWHHLPWWCHMGMAGIQANFELWPIFHSIYLIPTLNLRPGLNSEAFFTYIVKFPAFRLLSFMAYIYNIQGWQDGTRCWPHWPGPMTAGIQVNFELWPIFCSIYLIPYIKSEARTEFSGLFYIYSKNFQLSDCSPSWPTLITYKVGETGTRHWPHWPGPVTATLWQPHSLMSTLTLSTFNLININYDNLWLNTLNVVEGLMWIGKNSLNNLICHLSWLKKLSPTHTHPLISIREFLKPYQLLFFELESLIKCWMWIV